MNNWQKEPAWQAEWNRLVGSAKGLEIKNWQKYQPEMRDGLSATWCISYCSTDEDEIEDTAYMRWLKDALRRARARRGGPLVVNMSYLLSATACHQYDRQNFPRYVVKLLSCGFLIPTNEQFSPLKVVKKVKKVKNSSPEKNEQEDTPSAAFQVQD
jgi:hypothetical protein